MMDEILTWPELQFFAPEKKMYTKWKMNEWMNQQMNNGWMDQWVKHCMATTICWRLNIKFFLKRDLDTQPSFYQHTWADSNT